jgi:hypothetical protein
MAIVSWNGWRKESNKNCKEAYVYLTGRKLKPFIAVFDFPEPATNIPKDELDEQAKLEENNE